MMKNICKIFVLASLGCFLLTACKSSKKSTLGIDSKKLKNTVITAHLEEGIASNASVLYSAPFQLDWNVLKDNTIKGDIILNKDVPAVKSLNKEIGTKKDLTGNYYLAMTGFQKDDIQTQINNSLKEKFKKNAPQISVTLDKPEDILAYGYLAMDLQFTNKFEDLKDALIFRRGLKSSRVDTLGIKNYSDKNKAIGDQVDIIDYKGSNDFIISLKGSNTDEVILAKVQPGPNLVSTFDSIEKRIKEGKTEALQQGDALMIPKFNFDITHSYDDITGKNFVNKGFESLSITKALQETSFKFEVKSSGLASKLKKKSSKDTEPKNRDFSFDQPFMLYLKEKDAKYPYLAIWVDNPEILIKK